MKELGSITNWVVMFVFLRQTQASYLGVGIKHRGFEEEAGHLGLAGLDLYFRPSPHDLAMCVDKCLTS